MKENKITFEVWDDVEWTEGNPVYTFKTINEAIEFACKMANKIDAIEEIKNLWNTKIANAIGVGNWCIEAK